MPSWTWTRPAIKPAAAPSISKRRTAGGRFKRARRTGTPRGRAERRAVVDLDQASHQTGGGAFDFETADGEWQIQARAQDGDTELRAYQTVRVAGHDQDGLKLVLEAPFSIHVRLLFD